MRRQRERERRESTRKCYLVPRRALRLRHGESTSNGTHACVCVWKCRVYLVAVKYTSRTFCLFLSLFFGFLIRVIEERRGGGRDLSHLSVFNATGYSRARFVIYDETVIYVIGFSTVDLTSARRPCAETKIIGNCRL